MKEHHGPFSGKVITGNSVFVPSYRLNSLRLEMSSKKSLFISYRGSRGQRLAIPVSISSSLFDER